MPQNPNILQDLAGEIVATLERLTGQTTAVSIAKGIGGALEVRVTCDDGSVCLSVIAAGELERLGAGAVTLAVVAEGCIRRLRRELRRDKLDRWIRELWAQWGEAVT